MLKVYRKLMSANAYDQIAYTGEMGIAPSIVYGLRLQLFEKYEH